MLYTALLQLLFYVSLLLGVWNRILCTSSSAAAKSCIHSMQVPISHSGNIDGMSWFPHATFNECLLHVPLKQVGNVPWQTQVTELP